MPYAVHLFFDEKTDQAIRAIWQEMADSSVAPYLGLSSNRPHISLALCEELDTATCQKRLSDYAAHFQPMPVSFQTLGIFPPPGVVVYTGPVVTDELLTLQREVDGLLGNCCHWPEFDYYRPGKWIPHCTLAMEFDDNRLNEALEIASHLKLPLNGQIVGLGVIEFRPVKHLFTMPFCKRIN
jgi:2'-5' RNA ligase